MYVLHHADQPNIYADLPIEPKISPIVKTWKGISKYGGLSAITGAIRAIAAHAIMFGASRVKKKEEIEAKHALKEAEDDAQILRKGDMVTDGEPVIVKR